MKKVVCLVLTLILLLAGCQPTPEQNIVISKAEGQLEAAITETTPVPAYRTGEPEEVVQNETPTARAEPAETLRSMLCVPEKVQETFSGKVFGGSLSVTIDATPSVPDVTTVPVDEIAIRRFTAEEMENIVKRLLGDGPYYLYNAERGHKEALTANMQRILLHIEAFQNKVYGNACTVYEDLIAQEETYMNNYVSILQGMSEPGPMQPWPGQFSDARIDIANADNDRVSYSNGTFVFERHPEAPAETANDLDAWITEATELLRSLGNEAEAEYTGSEYSDEINRNRFHSNQGIDEDVVKMTFLPVYHGIPLYDYATCSGSDTAKDAAGVTIDHAPAYMQERILVNFSGGGIEHLQWDSPTEKIATVNENVALLSFDTVLNTFRTQILYHHYLDPARHGEPDPVFYMVVTDIRFSYLRVKRQDADTYYLIPVWDFMGYGYDDVFPDSPSGRAWYAHQSFLTINAIDGSIIDRNIGY